MKGTVKVAYWDTAGDNPPRIVGQISGTPTIKFIYPNKKNKRTTNKRKIVSAYNGAREFEPMETYAKSTMPNHVTRISGEKELSKFAAKADGFGLPKVVLFTKESATTPAAKALSTEFRRRALVGEVRATKPNKALLEKYGLEAWLADKAAPRTVLAVLKGVGADGGVAKMTKDGAPAKWSFGKATAYLNKVALKKAYFEDEVALEFVRAREEAAAPAAAAAAEEEEAPGKSEL